MSNAGVLKSAAPMEFINYRGKALKVSSLTLEQQEELAQFLRFKYFDECKQQFGGLPGKLAEYAFDKAKAKTDRIFPGTREHAEQFFTPAGQAYSLFLAVQKNDPSITLEQAYAILNEAPEAMQAVANAVGYREGEKQSQAKPLPINEILHVLCNEPYSHTPAEVRKMTLDDIAVIWCNPAGDAKPVYTLADQERAIREFQERQEKKKLGIWADDSIWK